MKIAFVGKGGSGKTTLASLFARVAESLGYPVLAIDADINQHLLHAISGDATLPPPPLGIEMGRIKEHLRGRNARIRNHEEMTKTTPPGEGSVLLDPSSENALFAYFAKHIGGIRLLATGGFTDEDLGVKCYHSKTGAVELLLNHIVDKRDEFIVVDMTAGADAFASGLFTRFDATYIIVEPTLKSVSVFQQYLTHAEPFGVQVFAIGNKVRDEKDRQFLETHLGKHLLGTFQYSSYVRSLEQGEFPNIGELEEENRILIEKMITNGNTQEKLWERYYMHAVDFHRKNAHAWANTALGIDLTTQIDPDFRYPTP